MIVQKTKNTLIQAEYQKDRVIVKKGDKIIQFTFKEVEAVNGCMEGEYMSNHTPQDLPEPHEADEY
jgi:RNase P/RNase MRP subunit p29